jgi:hypothetical protein
MNEQERPHQHIVIEVLEELQRAEVRQLEEDLLEMQKSRRSDEEPINNLSYAFRKAGVALN